MIVRFEELLPVWWGHNEMGCCFAACLNLLLLQSSLPSRLARISLLSVPVEGVKTVMLR